MSYDPGTINPATGVPFASEDEWNKYTTGESAKAKAGALASGYASDVASNAAQWNAQSPAGSGTGSSKGSAWQWTPTANLSETGYTPTGGSYVYQETSQGGAAGTPGTIGNLKIDSANGKIEYNTKDGKGGYSQTVEMYYDPTYNYGLGSSALGVIPLTTDASGNPTSFYAGTATGSGSKFTNLSDAIASAQAYTKWYNEKYPAGDPKSLTPGGETYDQWLAKQNLGTTSSGSTTGATTSSVNPKNDLTVPQQGEDYYESTKDFYGKPTEVSKVQSGLNWDPTQPTDSEQHWNAVSGKYNDPNHQTAEQSLWSSQGSQYLDPNHQTDSQTQWNNWASTFSDPAELDAMYKRAEEAAQTTLDRKASSGGWGDSGAAARATGNLGVTFQDAATKAKQSWAQMGMGLAGAADSANNAWATTGLGLANGADSSENTWANTGTNIAAQSDASRINSQNAKTAQNLGEISAASTTDQNNLAKIVGGQSSANSAEGQLINRATGNISAAATIGNAEATIASTGLGQAEQEKLQLDLASISAKLQAGTISATQAQNEATSMMTALGVVGKSADTIKNNLTQKKSDGTLYYA
jgi:hypothetical protein